jgi:hypothetical protein
MIQRPKRATWSPLVSGLLAPVDGSVTMYASSLGFFLVRNHATARLIEAGLSKSSGYVSQWIAPPLPGVSAAMCA